MFLRAVYGPNHPVSAEMRSAIRDRLIGAMAADLADENIGPASAAGDPTALQSHRTIVPLSPGRRSMLGLSPLWDSLLQHCQRLLPPPEAFTMRGLRIAAVPLVALLIVGSVWTTGWINQGGHRSRTSELRTQTAARTRLRQLVRSRGLLKPQPDDSQAEDNLRRDIAATEAALGPSHPLSPESWSILPASYTQRGVTPRRKHCARAR